MKIIGFKILNKEEVDLPKRSDGLNSILVYFNWDYSRHPNRVVMHFKKVFQWFPSSVNACNIKFTLETVNILTTDMI